MKFDNNEIGHDKLCLPTVTFGTSGLGNLFVALEDDAKCRIIEECYRLSGGTVVFDSAGKYGAGLALEVLGKCLKKLNIPPENVIISNKLAWVRTELKTPEPTFEPGVWKNIKHDAIQKISYDGIIECFEQGNKLLGNYPSQLVSVHDPDEYIAKAKDQSHAIELYNDVLNAYRALYDLKRQGKVKSVGIGAKDWRVIQRVVSDVPLDWVMIANSLTIKNHPKELLDFMTQLDQEGVMIINAAVFHSGFLVGGDYYDYRLATPGSPENNALLEWRNKFFAVCKKHNVKPAAACIQFGLHAPGVKSVALNTTDAKRVKENIDFATTMLPPAFWDELKAEGLINVNFFEKKVTAFNQ